MNPNHTTTTPTDAQPTRPHTRDAPTSVAVPPGRSGLTAGAEVVR